MKFLLFLILVPISLNAQVTYDEVKDPDTKIRGKYESYTAYDGNTYKVGDLFVLQFAEAGTYISVFNPGMLMTMKTESPNEVIRIEKFKAQHIMGNGLMYAMVVGNKNKKYQVAIDMALQMKEVRPYNKGVKVESIYDEMDETTTFQTSSLTIADGIRPYLDVDIRKVSTGKYYLRMYYRSKYRLDGCFSKDDELKIKTNLHGVIELTNVMKTECGNSGVLAYEVPKNILEKLAESKWSLMRIYSSGPYIEYRPDGNEDYFEQLASAILEY